MVLEQCGLLHLESDLGLKIDYCPLITDLITAWQCSTNLVDHITVRPGLSLRSHNCNSVNGLKSINNYSDS